MNEDIFKGQWNQLKGKVKQQWGKLTDDDLDRISGRQDEIIGLIQERYGWQRERAEMELNDFVRNQGF
jgi:uncharacterized protein YjbJ (UPF0337 family)